MKMDSFVPELKLPVINLSARDLNPSSSSWATTCGQVMLALEEYGCFVAVYDGVSSELHDEIFVASKQLMDLPHEVKILNTSEEAGHGYVGSSPKYPGVERLSIEKATTKQGVEDFTKLMWPSGNEPLCEVASTFMNRVAELEQIVMRMVAKSYGVEQHYESLLKTTDYILKFNKYKSHGRENLNLSAPPHTDKSFITIIHQKEAGEGLQIQTQDEKYWVDVHLSPSSFVIMAGDVYMAWTNGRIKAPFHRVMMKAEGNEDRYSMVISSYIRDVEVQAPEQLVDEEHPIQYKPFDHYKYINYHTYVNDRKLKYPLKLYCGV